MHLKIAKEVLLGTVSQVMGAIERRHTKAILSNLKIEVLQDKLVVTGSDAEVELVAEIALEAGACLRPGETTLPARKLLDICKSLPQGALVDLDVTEDGRCLLRSGQSRFTLGTLAAKDYPLLGNQAIQGAQVQVAQAELKRLLDKTAFAMAVQDVRFYLTGMLLEIEQNQLRAVTTDGHRLAYSQTEAQSSVEQVLQVIVPRKAVAELQRLLVANDSQLTLHLGRELLSVVVLIDQGDGKLPMQVCFTSKLIDGKFPDYRRVIPRANDKQATLDCETFKNGLQRVSILSNEKLRGILLHFEPDTVRLKANNQEQDEAVEDLAIAYQNESLEMSFNVQYLLDILSVIDGKEVQVDMAEANQSVRIQDPQNANQVYVVMPMRV